MTYTPEDLEHAILRAWRAAVTGCLNIAIDEQNRSNADDASMIILDAQEEIIRRLRGQLNLTQDDRAEVIGLCKPS